MSFGCQTSTGNERIANISPRFPVPRPAWVSGMSWPPEASGGGLRTKSSGQVSGSDSFIQLAITEGLGLSAGDTVMEEPDLV